MQIKLRGMRPLPEFDEEWATGNPSQLERLTHPNVRRQQEAERGLWTTTMGVCLDTHRLN